MLENLSLRTDALAGLVPAHLHSGRIGRLAMVVPWHKLGSLPVTLDLRDVSVLCSPLNERAWQPEEEEARQWSKKQAALRTRGAELTRARLEKLQGSLTPERDDGSLSPGLLARVLDNVQLTVTNVRPLRGRTNSSICPSPWACVLTRCRSRHWTNRAARGLWSGSWQACPQVGRRARAVALSGHRACDRRRAESCGGGRQHLQSKDPIISLP